MASFRIQGGHPLTGAIKPAGNKNAALPMLAACLLTDEPLHLKNVPAIQDVRVMLELLDDLGVQVDQRGHSVTLCAQGLNSTRLDPERCRRVRSSLLLTGPLAARHGRVSFAPPGGDIIGRRRLDTHYLALKALGIEQDRDMFALTARELHGADILLDEASVTATENTLMAACLAPGRSEIFPAACEPHVADLGRLLVKMGARIEGLGTNRIIIQGVRRLHGAGHRVDVDSTEIGSFLAAAAVTGGALEIPLPRKPAWWPVVARGFNRFDLGVRLDGRRIVLPAHAHLAVQQDLADPVPTLADGIWPAFPSDLMSVAIVVATQAEGTILFFERLFESRMYFVDHLIGMGARIVPCDPHRVLVNGPSTLHGNRVNSPDIRAGMALLVAALCARGETIIHHAEVIDRGYEAVDERLRSLGADIERV